jgi:hypothetical protein
MSDERRAIAALLDAWDAANADGDWPGLSEVAKEVENLRAALASSPSDGEPTKPVDEENVCSECEERVATQFLESGDEMCAECYIDHLEKLFERKGNPTDFTNLVADLRGVVRMVRGMPHTEERERFANRIDLHIYGFETRPLYELPPAHPPRSAPAACAVCGPLDGLHTSPLCSASPHDRHLCLRDGVVQCQHPKRDSCDHQWTASTVGPFVASCAKCGRVDGHLLPGQSIDKAAAPAERETDTARREGTDG